jgi:hypothetical protein
MKYINLRKNIFLLCVFPFFTGCTTSHISNFNVASKIVKIKDQNKQKYDNAMQVTAPISGIWTTKIQYGVTTIKLNLDGSGILCDTSTFSETNNNSSQYPIKYLENGILISQNGLIFKVKKIDSLILETDVSFGGITQPTEWLFKSDNNLKLASTTCREKLRQ